jgi:hypothetical protein
MIDEEQVTGQVVEETVNSPMVTDEQIRAPIITDPVVTEPEFASPLSSSEELTTVEQIIEPTPNPVIESEKPVEVTLEPAPIPEPAVAKPQITPSIPEPVAATTPEPQVSNIKPQVSAADLVASLSDEQLKAAAILYTKRNQAEISRKGVAKRKETMELNLREIVDFLSLNNGSPLPRIAKHTNITPGTTSKYLCQLIASGKVRAEGWAKTRRYYLK